MKRLLGGLLVVLMLASCASINSVSLTPVPSQRSNQVSATVEKLIFLGFNFENDFVDQLTQALMAQCPNGSILGILTKDETIHYFLAHKKRITATGFCQAATRAAGTMESGRSLSSEIAALLDDVE